MKKELDFVFNRSISVRHYVDVFIAGGGPSGIAAALGAARNGCSVYLAEGQACFGGMATAGMVPAFMQFSDGINFLAAGIGEEIFERLNKQGGTGYKDKFSIKAEVLKRVYDEMLLEANISFSLQTQLIGVEKQDDKVAFAILWGKSGIFAVKADVFIDCTGDGDLAAWAGAPYEKGDQEGNLMPGTLCSLWADVDWDRIKKYRDDEYLEQAFKDGLFSLDDRHLPGMWAVGEKTGGGNIGHAFGVDGTDERTLTKALVEQRRRLVEYERYYKKYLKGYEGMELVSTASLLGIRETRRIMGDYVLNINDFKNRAVFEDEIGRYCYPIDIHASKPDAAAQKNCEEDFQKNFRYAKGENYGIPYRSLVPRGLSNVLVAGRCISCDRYMQGSIRVMPGCFITGQAAGAAASIAVKEKTHTRGFDVNQLQKILKGMGAYLTSKI